MVDIYPAREYDDLGVSAADIMARMTHPDARHIAGLNDTADYLLGRLKVGDVLITLGAGDGYLVGETVLASLGRMEDENTRPLSGKASSQPEEG